MKSSEMRNICSEFKESHFEIGDGPLCFNWPLPKQTYTSVCFQHYYNSLVRNYLRTNVCY